MGQERLTGLALMHFKYDLDIDYNTILDMFARKYPRRMAFIDILDSDNQ